VAEQSNAGVLSLVDEELGSVLVHEYSMPTQRGISVGEGVYVDADGEAKLSLNAPSGITYQVNQR
jgi:hypothetical protein